MDNEEETEDERQGSRRQSEFAEDEEAMRDAEAVETIAEEEELMEAFATQTQTVTPSQHVEEAEEEDDLQEVSASDAPPVFRPLTFSMEENLEASVKRRLQKGYEAVLEEQPKWSLLAKVLKEIEDTIARVSETHAGEAISASQSDGRCPGNKYRPNHDGF